MKLSAPIFVLKNQAKALKRSSSITMIEALDQIAQREGYASWSLLQAKAKDLYPKTRQEVLGYLNAGDLMLIASRPGLGKTTFALQLLIQAFKEGRKCFYFSLEHSRKEVASKIATLDESIGENHSINFDFSDEICSGYVLSRTQNKVSENAVIVIDYLQLLDQKRSKPDLQTQVKDFKTYAQDMKCIFIFISQVDRSFELDGKRKPSLADVRLPNPLDLKLFNKTMFLHNGKQIFTSPSNFELD